MHNDPYQQNNQQPYERIPYEQPQEQPSSPYPPPPTSYMPPPYQPQQPPPYQQAVYGQPLPGYVQPPQPKKSRRWLWITLSIIGGVILLSCIGCSIASFVGFNFLKQAAGPAVTTGEYYQFIKQQDYTRAYALIDSNATITVNGETVSNDQQSFINAAQAADSTHGPVTSFSIQSSSNNLSNLTVAVTRQDGTTYDVHLTFVQNGSSAKISNMDGI